MDNANPNEPTGSTPPPPPPPLAPPRLSYPTGPALRPPPPPVPPARSRGRGWMIAALVLGVLLGLSLLGNIGGSVAAVAGSGGHHGARGGLVPAYLENNGARNDIMVIDVGGVITSESFDSAGNNLVSLISEQLDIATDLDRIKAVVLRVDSPGGEVLASDDIANLITDFQEETGKPVVAQMGSMAASGGYYVSAPCRWIVANRLTITGSIGVIMSGYNYRGLMDKLGLKPEVFKSGKFKDMLSSSKAPEEVLPEERQMVMDLIMETYGQFTNVVADGRLASNSEGEGDNKGKDLVPNWADYADGRILSGSQAHELGLVDELGNFDTAVARAMSLTGISAANLVAYRPPFDLGNLFRIFGQTEAKPASVKIDLGLDNLKLKKGHLYLLNPTVL